MLILIFSETTFIKYNNLFVIQSKVKNHSLAERKKLGHLAKQGHSPPQTHISLKIAVFFLELIQFLLSVP